MLHLSFVGTPLFVQAAMENVPAHGCYRVIERCKALSEARYNGQYAWQAANWIFADQTLFRSAKAEAFDRYKGLLQADPPRWYQRMRRRETAMTRLRSGSTVAAAAEAAGVHPGTVYAWIQRARDQSGSVTEE